MKVVQVQYNDEDRSFKTFHYVEEVRLDRNVRLLVLRVVNDGSTYINIDHLLSWKEVG